MPFILKKRGYGKKSDGKKLEKGAHFGERKRR